jgi:type I restriction enzyme S subunit
MGSWPTSRLGDHADIRARIGWRGLSAREYTDEGPLLVAGQHLDGGRVSWASCDHISWWRYDESPEIALRSGDVVLSKDGTIGRVARVDSLPSPATLNGTMMLVRAGETLDHRYLFHVLRGPRFQRLVADRVSGSSIPHLFQRDLVQLEIELPCLSVQRRIADALDAVDDAIAATERQVMKLARLAAGIERSLFDQLAGGPLIRLDRLASVDRGRFTARPRNDPAYFNGPYPFAQTGDVAACSRRLLGTASQSLNERGRRVSRSFPAGSIAVTIAANIADTAILSKETFFPDSVVGVVPSDPSTVRWLEMCIHRSKAQLNAVAPQSAQKNINLEDLRPLLVPDVPVEDQHRFGAIYEDVDRAVTLEGARLAKLRAVQVGLADDVLSGRTVPA